MSDIIITDLTAEELERAALQFKKQVEGVIDNVRNSMEGLRKLGEVWSGPKYNYFIQMWNTEVGPRLSELLLDWDQKTNTIFQELVQQYESVMKSDEFVDVNLVVDPEYYAFIKKPIELERKAGIYFAKEPVERIIGWNLDGYLGGIAGSIKVVSGVLQENLSKGSSNAISMFKEKASEYTDKTFNDVNGLINDYIGIIKTRKTEIETIEERARKYIQNI